MRRSEEGVALLSVLLIVAVVSVVATSVLEDVRFGVRRAANVADVAQARWYALGAEQLARAQARRLWERNAGQTTLEGDWQNRPFPFPIEGGLIVARLRDGGNCFNLNSVVTGEPPALSANPQGVAQFVELSEALGIPEARARMLAEALVDWIDADSDGSAEDDAYQGRARPYRTGNTLLAEVSELRAIQGFEPGYYNLLRPHLCALPEAEPTMLNLNTLLPEQAVLVTAITGGAVAPEQARRAIAMRPADGWRDPKLFWNAEPLREASTAQAQQQAELRTRYFALDTDVRYGGAEAAMSALFSQGRTGELELVARRWTRDE